MPAHQPGASCIFSILARSSKKVIILNDFYPFSNFICILFLQTFTSCHLITKMPLLFSWTFSNRHNHSLSITKLKNKSITSGAPKCFSLITNTSDPCNLHFFDKLLVYHNDMFFCGSKMFSVKFILGSSALSFGALATGWTNISFSFLHINLSFLIFK